MAQKTKDNKYLVDIEHERLSFFTQDNTLPPADEEPERAELRLIIESMPLEKVRVMLQFAKTVN